MPRLDRRSTIGDRVIQKRRPVGPSVSFKRGETLADTESDPPDYTKFAAIPATLARPSSVLLPAELSDYIQELEMWALANREDARQDTIKFWALKGPAILCSASSGVFAYLQWALAGLIASGIASICIVMDGLLRAGLLRSIHIRAFHDIRALESRMRDDWLIGQANCEQENKLVARILKGAKDKREEILKYIISAEAGASEAKTK